MDITKGEITATSFAPLKWQPPPPHHFKKNMAYDIFQTVGLEIVIRNSNGVVMAACSGQLLLLLNPKEACLLELSDLLKPIPIMAHDTLK